MLDRADSTTLRDLLESPNQPGLFKVAFNLELDSGLRRILKIERDELLAST
jgi:hypothetical protein